MLFKELARYLGQLEKTSARNAMTEYLAVLYGELVGDEVRWASYLILGGLGPAYERVDFQLADKMVVKAIAQAYGIETSRVWGEYKKFGDLGTVTGKLPGTHSTSSGQARDKVHDLNIGEVYEELLGIAKESGLGSQERKLDRLAQLLNNLEAESVKYVVRIVLGRLRLGFSDKTILDALSVMLSGGKSVREEIEQAYQIYPDIGEIALLLKQFGRKGLSERVKVVLGVPVMPALCQRLKTADEMIDKMGEVFVEPKFDGTRVQIHIRKGLKGWEVKTFTRNLEETTWMFPELTGIFDQVKAQELILDSEAVGMDPKTGRMLPFQETITRKRKHEVEEAIGRVPLQFNIFDILYCEGKSYINEPFYLRRQKLLEVILPGIGIKVVETIRTNQARELREFHRRKLNEGYEGVVVKQVNGSYEPGRRGFNWVKFKEIETANGKLSDTIDAVVMGFNRGKGKRTKFGLGAFLVGLQEKDGGIVTLAKIGTGLTDAQWRELKRRLDDKVCIEVPLKYKVDKNLVPDVWVEPNVIVEIAADEVTKSPIHSAGYALRFPRLVRFREDKGFEDITTIQELMRIKG